MSCSTMTKSTKIIVVKQKQKPSYYICVTQDEVSDIKATDRVYLPNNLLEIDSQSLEELKKVRSKIFLALFNSKYNLYNLYSLPIEFRKILLDQVDQEKFEKVVSELSESIRVKQQCSFLDGLVDQDAEERYVEVMNLHKNRDYIAHKWIGKAWKGTWEYARQSRSKTEQDIRDRILQFYELKHSSAFTIAYKSKIVHYVAFVYNPKSKTLYRFDPGCGEYEDGDLTEIVLDQFRKLVPNIIYKDLTYLSFDRHGRSVQSRTGDGFCQTWTLIFLRHFDKRNRLLKQWSKMNSCQLYSYIYNVILKILDHDEIYLQYLYNYFTSSSKFKRKARESDEEFINRLTSDPNIKRPEQLLHKVLDVLQ